MTKIAMIAGATALAWSLGGCSDDTKAENEVEAQAEAIDDAYEADAKVQDAFAENAPDEQAQHDAADRLREQGDQVRQDLKEQADEMGHDTRAMEREAN